MRTQRKIIIGTFLILLAAIGLGYYFSVAGKVDLMPPDNKFINNISLYLAQKNEPASQKTVIFNINWHGEMDAASAASADNFFVEHVVPQDGKWLTAINGKSAEIILAQYVFDPFADSTAKQAASQTEKNKITQLNVIISPPPEVDDYFRIRARNIKTKSGEVLQNPEFGVVQLTEFHKFIKM